MLHHLSVENLAIVEHLELRFKQGLTIISGETGAGKSILIEALGLVLGERADSEWVRQGCESAKVTALFTLPPTAQRWLAEQGLGEHTQCLISRIVNHNGRSRAYLNDLPVSIQLLRQLGEYLIDIHGQHAHQSLLKQEIQLQLLDDLAAETQILASVKQAYQHWKSLQTALHTLGGQDREAKLALLRYQVQELEKFALTPAAIETLEAEHRRLAHAHKLLENSQRALNLLDADETAAALSYLNQARHQLNEIQQHDHRLGNLVTLLETALIQTQEAVGELRHYLDGVEIDPHRLQEVEQQIAALQDLARKHKIRFNELPAYFKKLTDQLTELENYEDHARRLEKDLEEAVGTYRKCAEALHQQRIQTSHQLAHQITAYMHQLGMATGQLTIAVGADEEAIPTPRGTDLVEFLVSTNPGQTPKPLHKIASGGELSRISLAIQVIIAQHSGVPILVFDEVDVGIGGSVAEIVGQLLSRLGQQRQVLCITHLPQVACQGHHHLQVSKTFQQESTRTTVRCLTNKQRIEEIARMLGGLEITSQTLAHAREMLQRSHAKD